MLQVLLFCFTLFQALRTGTCRVAPEVGEAVVKAHNEVRAQVATRGLYQKIFGDAPGSKSLFKLDLYLFSDKKIKLESYDNQDINLRKTQAYDRSHAALAAATIGVGCKHSRIYMNGLEKSENFITYRSDGTPNNKTLLQYFLYAVEDWRDTVIHPLRPDVKYTDTSMEPFANMIYYRTLRFGCAYRFCQALSKIALACVYDNKPRLDEPLYIADSVDKKGCTRNKSCKKLIQNAYCEGEDRDDEKRGPLCEMPLPKVKAIIETPSTTASPATLPQTEIGFTVTRMPSQDMGFTVTRMPSNMGGQLQSGGQIQSGFPVNLQSCQVQQIAGLPAYILRCQDGNRQGTAQNQFRQPSKIFICDVHACEPITQACQGGQRYQLFCQQQEQRYNPNPSQVQNQPIRCGVDPQRFQAAAQQQQVLLPTLVCQPVQQQNGFMMQGMNPGAIPANPYNVVYSLPFNRTSNLTDNI